MENFRVENSSTPRHTIHRKSPENMLNATCNRPMRRCKPTSLVEKNVKSKIRNETAEKSLSTKRK